MSRLVFCVVVVCAAAITGWSAPTQAAEEPPVVAEAVQNAAQECRSMGGRPNTEAMLSVDDLNGDGGEDWIVDFSKLRCDGAGNPFCGTGGCSLQIFLWAGGQDWRQSFDEVVRKYRIGGRAGRRMLETEMGGAACGRPNYQTCRLTYAIGRTAITRAR